VWRVFKIPLFISFHDAALNLRSRNRTSCASIRERLPDVRGIIVSNHTVPAYIEEAFQIGANGYVVKESATFQLPKAIQDALDGKVFRPAQRGRGEAFEFIVCNPMSCRKP
jgi:DNA-binding NarL/FixJ family response regulator